MKKIQAFCIMIAISVSLVSCAVPETKEMSLSVAAPENVVVLSSSLAEIWLLAGGNLTGATSDIVERNFDGVSEDIHLVGSVKEPNLEIILSLMPDFVIFSEDIAGHKALEQTLTDASIPFYAAHVETVDDYLETLKQFCLMTGRDDLYESNGVDVQKQVDALLEAYERAESAPLYLLMRVHSSGARVITEDQSVCNILSELGATNIATNNKTLLSDLSLEAILRLDPDYIFILTMGEEAAALQTLDQIFMAQPIWETLSAVKENRVNILPKELFHYKPNSNWGEAYELLIELLTA